MFLPTAAPVTNVSVTTYNSVTTNYDAVDASLVRWSEDGVVDAGCGLPSGFQSVRVAFTTGWTADTLPKDLRSALMDLTLLKLQQINNLSLIDPTSPSDAGTDVVAGPLKRVQSDTYSEEYDTAQSTAIWKAKTAQLSQSMGDDVPPQIFNTVLSYRRAWAI
jgi:hypothetical protein